ncbi:polysaccharide biosynthesis/export family protein [Mucilaginibacter glaciei]|uniref:Polysaccharide biosynthesis/export family protein n=1 Tax=Mucilaginibacter glaciei TaxID=2772109 RepID=A0A926S1R2_9SPHI|nr:polysaccharide biosynthesis/export family protein [Mucilaginibacter glaciei]MBD1393338.1 polysaccharide biosynthesis/export family protein [Mucilaginibacter glaciei]
MNIKRLLFLSIVAIVITASSCTSYKNIPYFQNVNRDSIFTETITNYSQLTIQPADLLGIHVTSLNNEADAKYNYNLERAFGNSNLDRAEENAVVGYLVDQDGNIKMPSIGTIKVSGLTTTQIARLLETKLLLDLKQPTVNVRIQNFKISILGDVKNPGTFNITNERITLSEALSRSGDLNITGIRSILLIRELEGKRTYVPIDLTSKDIITSPYYYLKNNDVIYVKPNRARSEDNGSTFQRAGLIVSVLSIIAILLQR